MVSQNTGIPNPMRYDRTVSIPFRISFSITIHHERTNRPTIIKFVCHIAARLAALTYIYFFLLSLSFFMLRLLLMYCVYVGLNRYVCTCISARVSPCPSPPPNKQAKERRMKPIKDLSRSPTSNKLLTKLRSSLTLRSREITQKTNELIGIRSLSLHIISMIVSVIARKALTARDRKTGM